MRTLILTIFLCLLAIPAVAVTRYSTSGSGTAIDESITFGNSNVYVKAIFLVVSAASGTSENLVITHSDGGAAIYNVDFAGETSYAAVFDGDGMPVGGRNEETLDVEYTNTDGVDWELTVYYEVQ